ncbi:hypothetical protein CHARACLAT_015509 [Characodon lateralis]|uniref:Uncharacterized protein n=1 Tax=Characodon lateralis TaxID=208331 RepID=A0ABU7F3R5_9TELE|nr:hypothetical protein [Characodon lateralis]
MRKKMIKMCFGAGELQRLFALPVESSHILLLIQRLLPPSSSSRQGLQVDESPYQQDEKLFLPMSHQSCTVLSPIVNFF